MDLGLEPEVEGSTEELGTKRENSAADQAENTTGENILHFIRTPGTVHHFLRRKGGRNEANVGRIKVAGLGWDGMGWGGSLVPGLVGESRSLSQAIHPTSSTDTGYNSTTPRVHDSGIEMG